MRTTDPEMVVLCRAYWEQDDEHEFVHKASALAAGHGVQASRLAQIVREHCTARLAKATCQHCGRGEVVRSRADLARHGRAYTGGTCEDCRAEEARKVAAADAERKARRRQIIVERFDESLLPCAEVDVRRLPLRTALSQLALARAATDEELAVLRPQRDWTSTLTPGGRGDVDVLKDLFNNYMLALSPSSAPAAFDWSEDEQPERFWYESVHWRLATEGEQHDLASSVRALDAVLRDQREWPVTWHLELRPLWLALAVDDCLEYLERRLEEYHLPLKVGDRLRQVLLQALNDFSVGQVYNFIWRAAKDAAAFYQKTGNTKSHAANTVPGAIERACERALAQGWDVRSFGRDWNSSEGAMIQLLAYVVTKVGDDYMNVVPRLACETEDSLRISLDDAAQMLELDVDQLIAIVRDTGTTAPDFCRCVDDANAALRRAAEAWAAAVPNWPARGAASEDLLRDLGLATNDLDRALAALGNAVLVPPVPVPDDPLAPRHPVYLDTIAAARQASTT